MGLGQKIKPPAGRRFSSMFPFPRVPIEGYYLVFDPRPNRPALDARLGSSAWFGASKPDPRAAKGAENRKQAPANPCIEGSEGTAAFPEGEPNPKAAA